MNAELKFIFKNELTLEAYFCEDLVGYLTLGENKEGVFIQYSEIISEFNRGRGWGKALYVELLRHCKENNIKLFRMKNPTFPAQSIWKSLEKSHGITYKDRSDLMSTNSELEVLL